MIFLIFFEASKAEITEKEAMLRKYTRLLLQANEIARLTGPADEETLWNEHIADCAAALPLLPQEGKFIDVGTGGGLPGLVFAICRPHAHVTLLDSIAKKCALVEKMAAALCLKNVAVVCSRSEDFAKNNLEKFNIVTARAVCATGILAEYLAPFARIKGRIIAFKGPRVVDELNEIGAKWQTLGLSLPKLMPYALGEAKHFLAVWEKISQTAKGIPRRPGMAEKFPWYKR
ncbi:MAG: 16S rRNA (guanine(527)-N(7))-methyltransferase RsmG [Synergistaceae bacterium]|nr:16S rRNA (guanine(527)-N(7))-methyltransferase RsmG [Synergistaceae bacterium]